MCIDWLSFATVQSEKLTKRVYDDACGAAHAMELIGERWGLLVVRELFWGPKRFGEIRASLPGISANVLTQRLEGLEAAGVLHRRRLPPPANAQVYELTDWGYEAEPLFQVLGRWAARSPVHDPSLPLSPSSLMLSFRTMFSAERARGMQPAVIGFVLGAEQFRAAVRADGIEISRGDAEDAAVVFTGSATAIAAAIYGGAPLETLGIKGDQMLALRFTTLFPLPAKAR
jgi:DNA-binding HxlR family transcriptional regulator